MPPPVLLHVFLMLFFSCLVGFDRSCCFLVMPGFGMHFACGGLVLGWSGGDLGGLGVVLASSWDLLEASCGPFGLSRSF